MKSRTAVFSATQKMARRQARFRRVTALRIAMLTAVLASLGASSLGAQQSGARDHSAIPRTAWGDPVFSGVWNYSPDLKTNPGVGSNDIVYGNAADPVHLQMALKAVANGILGGPPAPSPKAGATGGNAGANAAAAAAGFGTNTMALNSPSLVLTADGQLPYQEWARAKATDRRGKYRDAPSVDYIPTGARCLLYGVPHSMMRANPHVYQFRTHILMTWEYPQMDRIIWTDGRPPLSSELELWQGYSVGHWQGDTLTVTTTNQNAFPWLDQTGDFFDGNIKTTETFKILSANSILYHVKVEDPTVFTMPWDMEWTYNIAPPPPPNAPPLSTEILEVACVEGNRSHALDEAAANWSKSPSQ